MEVLPVKEILSQRNFFHNAGGTAESGSVDDRPQAIRARRWMGKLFGTDGIRGVANEHPMTAEMAIEEIVFANNLHTIHPSPFELSKAYRTEDARGRYHRLSEARLPQRMLAGENRVSVPVKIIRSNPVCLVAGLAEFGQGGRLFRCNFLEHGSTDIG